MVESKGKQYKGGIEMESVAYNKNLGFEMRFRYGQKSCSKLVKSLGYAREINEAIDIVKSIYKKGAVYRTLI